MQILYIVHMYFSVQGLLLKVTVRSSYYTYTKPPLTPPPPIHTLTKQLLALVFSQHIEESKMQGLLEYLSNSSVHLLAAVLNKLASDTATAGMELLRYWTI